MFQQNQAEKRRKGERKQIFCVIRVEFNYLLNKIFPYKEGGSRTEKGRPHRFGLVRQRERCNYNNNHFMLEQQTINDSSREKFSKKEFTCQRIVLVGVLGGRGRGREREREREREFGRKKQ